MQGIQGGNEVRIDLEQLLAGGRLAAVAGDGSCAASCATKPGSLGELLECEFFSAHSTEQILSLSESELFVALGEYGVGVFERKALVRPPPRQLSCPFCCYP